MITICNPQGDYNGEKILESKFLDDFQLRTENYAGIYHSEVSTGEDQGYDQSMIIEINDGKLRCTYTWKSWNDGPNVEPSSGIMSNVSIKKNVFIGYQNVYGGGDSPISGKFMKIDFNGDVLRGFLDGDMALFWTRESK